ncbi:hypothetical protein HBH89_250170 [Parastagonospora nodorum]|nr:hypothetical protein HBH89_250170 [Parastagonospora nodorum]
MPLVLSAAFALGVQHHRFSVNTDFPSRSPVMKRSAAAAPASGKSKKSRNGKLGRPISTSQAPPAAAYEPDPMRRRRKGRYEGDHVCYATDDDLEEPEGLDQHLLSDRLQDDHILHTVEDQDELGESPGPVPTASQLRSSHSPEILEVPRPDPTASQSTPRSPVPLPSMPPPPVPRPSHPSTSRPAASRTSHPTSRASQSSSDNDLSSDGIVVDVQGASRRIVPAPSPPKSMKLPLPARVKLNAEDKARTRSTRYDLHHRLHYEALIDAISGEEEEDNGLLGFDRYNWRYSLWMLFASIPVPVLTALLDGTLVHQDLGNKDRVIRETYSDGSPWRTQASVPFAPAVYVRFLTDSRGLSPSPNELIDLVYHLRNYVNAGPLHWK